MTVSVSGVPGVLRAWFPSHVIDLRLGTKHDINGTSVGAMTSCFVPSLRLGLGKKLGGLMSGVK